MGRHEITESLDTTDTEKSIPIHRSHWTLIRKIRDRVGDHRKAPSMLLAQKREAVATTKRLKIPLTILPPKYKNLKLLRKEPQAQSPSEHR